jgi:hypothetical protein
MVANFSRYCGSRCVPRVWLVGSNAADVARRSEWRELQLKPRWRSKHNMESSREVSQGDNGISYQDILEAEWLNMSKQQHILRGSEWPTHQCWGKS